MLNPATVIKANVPIKETTIATNGISVERISCKKTYTTRITRIMASIKVFTTSWIEAYKKSFVLINFTTSIPFGKSFEASSRKASILLFTSVAFDPAVWKTIQEIPGLPFVCPI